MLIGYVFLIVFFSSTLLAGGLLAQILFESLNKKREGVIIHLSVWCVLSIAVSIASPWLFDAFPNTAAQKHNEPPKIEQATIPPVSRMCVKTTYNSIREEPVVVCGDIVPKP